MNNIHGIHGNCKLGLLDRALLSSAILMIKIKDLNNPYLQNTFDEGGHEAAREPEPGRPEGDRLHLTRCCEQHSPMRGHQLCIHITANNQQKIEFHIERMSQYPPTLLSSRIWNLFRRLLQHGNMRVRDENTHACVSETHGSCMFHQLPTSKGLYDRHTQPVSVTDLHAKRCVRYFHIHSDWRIFRTRKRLHACVFYTRMKFVNLLWTPSLNDRSKLKGQCTDVKSGCGSSIGPCLSPHSLSFHKILVLLSL